MGNLIIYAFFVSLISTGLLYRIGMFKSNRIPSDRDYFRSKNKSELVRIVVRALLVATIISWVAFFILLAFYHPLR